MDQQTPSGTPPLSAADLTSCEREPIHIPGLIQPHGILFALTNTDFRITAISANVADHLGHDPQTLLNTRIEQLLPPESFTILQQAADQQNENPIHLVEFFLHGAAAGPWRAIVHATPTGILLEALIPQPNHLSHAFSIPFSQFEHGTRRLQVAKGIPAICACLAAEVRRLIGYDRVKVYRFAADHTGEVLAEDNSGRLPSYLGLHFPASDIPAQARALYLRNPEREIPDIDSGLQKPIWLQRLTRLGWAVRPAAVRYSWFVPAACGNTCEYCG